MPDETFWMVRDKATGKFYTAGGSVWLIGDEPPPQIYLPMICTKAAAELYARELGNADIVEFRSGEQQPFYPAYNQRDVRWGKNRMNNSALELEDWGCLVTCAASMLVHATGDTSITPGTLNTWLTANGGYVETASFVFASIEKNWPIKFLTSWDYPYPKRADTDAINARIEQGQYALIKVDFVPNTANVDEHWVLAMRVNEDQTYEIMDPWYGSYYQMPPAYAKSGWQPGDTIFRVAFYEVV